MKNVSPRRMKLGFNIVANGAHVAGWRMPGAKANAAMDIRLWKDMARAAERARIHFMFWADGIAVRHSAKDDDELSFNPRIDVFEPLTVIGALAAVTERLGFVASASTTYNEPYHVARKFSSLDNISVTAVPEANSLTMLAAGLGLLGLARRRARK